MRIVIAALFSLTLAAQAQDEEAQKKRFGEILKEMTAMRKKSEADPALRSDPAFQKRGEELMAEGDKIVKALTGGDRGKTDALVEECIKKYVPEEYAAMADARRSANEMNAAASLKSLALAESDFRSNDRDGNQLNDFWVGDVHGLWALMGKDGYGKYPAAQPEFAIRLIEADLARADSAPGKWEGLASPPPGKPVPKAGYLYNVLTDFQDGKGEAKKYHAGTGVHFDQFAFCGWPAEYGTSGKMTIAITEGNVLMAKDTGGKAVTVWPLDPAKDGWIKFDDYIEKQRANRPGPVGTAVPQSNERNAVGSLKTLTTAQADFRSNDRDGNRVNDFWVGDVHALWALMPMNSKGEFPAADSKNRINLIEQSVAEADAAPLKVNGLASAPPDKPRAKAGYYFAAVQNYEDKQGAPVKLNDGTNRSYDRYGFCAWPVEYGKAGKMTFFVDQDATVWKKDLAGKAIEAIPASPGASGWTKADR